MTDEITIPPFPKMGGHGGGPDKCVENLEKTFGKLITKEKFTSPEDIAAWWPEGLVIRIVKENGKVKVISNSDELNRIGKKK